MNAFRLAVAQLPITADVPKNAALVRESLRQAAAGGARLVQFPEGMLSGYAKENIRDWAEVNWAVIREELKAIMALAADLHIWVALGSAHPLTPPHRPHNSLYIISDQGQLVNRYDKRCCSFTETTQFYSPGLGPVVFEIDGFRFGCMVCVEINFPALFMEYEQLGVDCVLLSAYPVDTMFETKARAHAAIHNIWMAVSVPAAPQAPLMSGLIDPSGEYLECVKTSAGLSIATLNRDAPNLDIPLRKARPWRAAAGSGEFYTNWRVTDSRSADKTCL